MKKAFIFTFLIFIFLAPNIYSWQRNVLISPLRVVMDDKNKSFSVKIVNPGDLKTSYRISLVSMEADELGRVKETDKNNIIKEMIRFSPKRVTLPPRGVQTIRLIARPKSNLPQGEYRVHLKVSPLPPPPGKKVQEKKY
jgi:P pilus assembly chaperone PapD